MNYKRTVCIGLAFMGISAFWQLYDNIIPLILKNTFELEETVSGAIMAIDNVIAVLLLPVLGAWSDRVDTRFGKRMPFIVVGTLLSVVFMMLVPAADRSRNLILFILSLGAVLLSMALYRSPAVALMPDLTPPKLRSQGNAVINVMGALGAMCSLVMIHFMVPHEEHPDYTPLFAAVAAVMLIGLVLLLWKIKEKQLAAKIAEEYTEEDFETQEQTGGKTPVGVKRSLIFGLLTVSFYYISYNGVTTAYSRYAQEIWGLTGGSFALSLMVVAVTAFASYIPLGYLAAKIGRKKVIMIGLLMMLVAFAAISAFSAYDGWINFWFVMVGVGGSAVGVNIFPVVVDMCGKEDVGRYTGLYYTFSMAAQIVTPILSGVLLEHVSYRTLFPYAAVFALLGFITMSQVHHGDHKPEQGKKLLEYLDN